MGRKLGSLFAVAITTLSVLFAISSFAPVSATAGINQEISFEGKVVTAAGINIPDGTYNMEFKIYTAAGSCAPTTGVGCTLGWTEDWLRNNSQGVTFTSGTFQVNLDDVAANNFSGIDFNTYPLYLSMTVGSTNVTCTPFSSCTPDTEMKPYIKLTATPYALNSNALQGLAASAFGQLAAGQTFTGANIFQPSADATGLTIKQTATASPVADIFKVQGTNGTSNFIQITSTAANNGAVNINSFGANAIALNSGGALTFTGAAASTWDLGAAHTLSLQTTNNGAITTGTGLLTVGGSLTFSGSTARTITGPGTGALTVTAGSSAALTLTGNAASTWSTSSGALTITSAAAAVWSTSAGTLTVQSASGSAFTASSQGAGQSNFGTVGTGATAVGNSTGATTIQGSGIALTGGAASSFTTSVGALTLTAAAASTWSTSSGALIIQSASTLSLQSASGSAFTASSQGAGQSNFGTVGTGVTLVGNATGNTELQGPLYAGSDSGVLIGDGSVTATPLLLGLNNSSLQGAETAGNCSTTINSGAIYYSASTASANSVTTNELRGCINGSWEDIVTSDQLGILLFGVAGDSGTSPGDYSGVTGYDKSPCKVRWASSTSVTVAPCVAYSGGRKVVVPSAVTITGLGTAGSVRFHHICMTGTNGEPTATASNTSETAAVPAFSATAPILCLATVHLNTTPAITQIYDTRVFTTSIKTFVSAAVAVAPGWIVIQSTATNNAITTTTGAATTGVRGVVAVGNTAGSTATVSAIVVIGGPVFVESTGVITAGQAAKTSTTAGYAESAAPAANTFFVDLGLIQDPGNAGANPCTVATSCQNSVFLDVVPY